MIDLRSDTLTIPTPEMLLAITKAELGDDGRVGPNGRGEDPTVNKLLDRAMELTGKEAAIVLPTGTMGNLVAMMTYTNYNDFAAVSSCNHIKRSEKGVFNERPGGVRALLYESDKYGFPILDSLKSVLEGDDKAKVVCTENTNNFCGGTCLSVEQMRELHDFCSSYGVPLHLDGARIFNAAAALGVSVGELVKNADSVMFCISKGLRAPIGSVLCGTSDFIKRARDNAKYCGGVMRQAGVIAAPGLIALENGYEVALRDNKHARILGEKLAAAGGCLRVDLDTVQSNMVKVGVQKHAAVVISELKELGVKVGSVDDSSFRLVTHADNSEDEILNAAEILVNYSVSNQ